MPRQKRKPKNESPAQAKIRRQLEKIANHAPRSDKTSWNRKKKNMDKLIGKIHPLEQSILDIRRQAIPIYDDIAILREEMVKTCVHPYEMLVHKENYIVCKFCNSKISMPKDIT